MNFEDKSHLLYKRSWTNKEMDILEDLYDVNPSGVMRDKFYKYPTSCNYGFFILQNKLTWLYKRFPLFIKQKYNIIREVRK